MCLVCAGFSCWGRLAREAGLGAESCAFMLWQGLHAAVLVLTMAIALTCVLQAGRWRLLQRLPLPPHRIDAVHLWLSTFGSAALHHPPTT